MNLPADERRRSVRVCIYPRFSSRMEWAWIGFRKERSLHYVYVKRLVRSRRAVKTGLEKTK